MWHGNRLKVSDLIYLKKKKISILISLEEEDNLVIQSHLFT